MEGIEGRILEGDNLAQFFNLLPPRIGSIVRNWSGMTTARCHSFWDGGMTVALGFHNHYFALCVYTASDPELRSKIQMREIFEDIRDMKKFYVSRRKAGALAVFLWDACFSRSDK